MGRNWRWVLPCYVLSLPLAVVAFAYAFVIARARSWEWIDGCLTFVAGTKTNREGLTVSRLWGNPGGQCWSWVVGFSSEEHRDRADLRVHEYTHVAQVFILCLVAWAAFPLWAWGLGAGWGAVVCGLTSGLWFAVPYGACFLVGYVRRGFRDWHAAYLAIPFERHAYAVQGKFLADDLGHYAWGEKR